MFTKITQALSILSFLLSASMAGGGYFAYRYFSSPQFKTKVMNEVMQEVQKILPGQIDKNYHLLLVSLCLFNGNT